MSTYGIYTSGLGALGQSAKLDQIANNLANVSTPGFRRDHLSFRQRLVEALEDRPDLNYYNAQVDRHGGAPFIDQSTFDRKSGGYEQTHRPLDLAVLGEGFFSVQDLKTGGTFYTRAGNFTLAADGRIVTPDGQYQLLSDEGRGLAVEPGLPGSLQISREGRMLQGDIDLGQVGVFDFDDYSRLLKTGDNVYRNLGASASKPERLQVSQGTLELSSVNPVTEMVEMVKAFRSLESNLQMLKIQDGVLERSVNDFGRPAR